MWAPDQYSIDHRILNTAHEDKSFFRKIVAASANRDYHTDYINSQIVAQNFVVMLWLLNLV